MFLRQLYFDFLKAAKKPEWFFGMVLLSLFLICAPVRAEVTVVYPLVREPYSNVYRDFVTGIRQAYPGKVNEYPINSHFSASLLFSGAERESQRAVIALGNKSLEAVVSAGVDVPILAAVTQIDENYSVNGGIVLEADAEIFLSRLLELFPQAGAVHVVYDPSRHQALMDAAAIYLKKRNVLLNSVRATDLRGSALAFRGIVKQARRGDAIWLMSDASLIDGTLLKLVLDTAWDKKLAVFSSNPVFVKRGALFAIYPDNIGIGYRLGKMAHEITSGKRKTAAMETLRDVKVAFNERTGNHIGVKLTSQSRANIEFFLPEM